MACGFRQCLVAAATLSQPPYHRTVLPDSHASLMDEAASRLRMEVDKQARRTRCAGSSDPAVADRGRSVEKKEDDKAGKIDLTG
jgi:ATP-dependent Clp protease ATP-binding subunit ClpA